MFSQQVSSLVSEKDSDIDFSRENEWAEGEVCDSYRVKNYIILILTMLLVIWQIAEILRCYNMSYKWNGMIRCYHDQIVIVVVVVKYN